LGTLSWNSSPSRGTRTDRFHVAPLQSFSIRPGSLFASTYDRDIVAKVLAKGDDPTAANVGQFTEGQSEAVTIGADDSSRKR
jgi:hypothetical protein